MGLQEFGELIKRRPIPDQKQTQCRPKQSGFKKYVFEKNETIWTIKTIETMNSFFSGMVIMFVMQSEKDL